MSLVRKAGVDALVARLDPRLRGALVHGPDRTAVAEIAARFLKAVALDGDDPFRVALLTEGELDPERLAEELSALSLTGGRRVVRVRLTAEIGSRDRMLQEALDGHLADAHCSDAFFLMECPALDKRSGLRKSAEASDRFAAVALYEEEAGDVGRLARDALSAAGIAAPAALVQRLAERLPRDRGLAQQILASLIAYLGDERTLSPEAIDAVLPPDAGLAAEDVALSAFGGRVDATVSALSRARFLGESGPALIRSLGMHRSRLARVKAAVDGGAQPGQAVKGAGVFWKAERDFIAQLELWRGGDLERVQDQLLQADADCKTAGSPDELIAHHLALDIARFAARRLR